MSMSTASPCPLSGTQPPSSLPSICPSTDLVQGEDGRGDAPPGEGKAATMSQLQGTDSHEAAPSLPGSRERDQAWF